MLGYNHGLAQSANVTEGNAIKYHGGDWSTVQDALAGPALHAVLFNKQTYTQSGHRVYAHSPCRMDTATKHLVL